MQIKTISEYKNSLGEGIWWNDKSKLLHWADIIEGKFFTYNPKTKKESFEQFSGKLGCFAPCKNGCFLIGLGLSFYIYNPISKEIKKFIDLKDEPPINRINDGTTDPYGRFWVGTMTSEDFKKEQSGSLYCIYPNKRVKKFLNGIFTSNGLAFNKSGTKMYFADTGKDVQTIWHFDYNLEEGIPMNKKVFTKTFDLNGRPDGAMVDIDDFYWVAGVEGSELYRFNSKGNIDDIVKLPVQKPTKPVFGGYNLDKIYLTSIGRGYNNSDNEVNGLTLEISNHKFRGYPYKDFDY